VVECVEESDCGYPVPPADEGSKELEGIRDEWFAGCRNVILTLDFGSKIWKEWRVVKVVGDV